MARGVAGLGRHVGGAHVREHEEEQARSQERPPRGEALLEERLQPGEEKEKEEGVPQVKETVHPGPGPEGGEAPQEGQGEEGQGEPWGLSRKPEEGQGEGGVAHRVEESPGQASRPLQGPGRVPKAQEEKAQAEGPALPPAQQIGPAPQGQQGGEDALAPGSSGGEEGKKRDEGEGPEPGKDHIPSLAQARPAPFGQGLQGLS